MILFLKGPGSRRRMATAATLLTAGWLLGTGAAHSQDGGAAASQHFSHVTLVPPEGWTRTDAAGWALYIPPGLSAGQSAYIGISPGGESNRALADEFAALIKSSANGMKVTPVAEAQAVKDKQGLEGLLQAVALEDEKGAKQYRLLFARRNGNRFESMAFAASSADLFQKYLPQVRTFVNNMTFDGAPIPAAPAPAPAPSDETSTPAPVAKPQNAAPTAPPRTGAAPLSPTSSAIVRKNAKGQLAVANASGKAVKGVPLSRFNTNIQPPSIAVAPNGTIHVAFIEQQKESPFHQFVYHRSSSDNGKTWSAAKNLSEVLPEMHVGTVKVIADASGRVYVIWRSGLDLNFQVPEDQHSGPGNNLVYRVLENGAWNGKAVFIHPPGTRDRQSDGSASWFASVGTDGKVHVLWVANPDLLHPELLGGTPGSTYRPHSNNVGIGMVLEAVLSGNNPGTPREAYLPKVTQGDDNLGLRSDELDTVNGYVDASGPHFIAKVNTPAKRYEEKGNRIEIIENGTTTPVVTLPGETFATWHYPPTLLIDAKGKRHVLAMYTSGEQPEVRDYAVGEDAEPVVVRATRKLLGFEAFQGPSGMMVALMAMNDTAKDGDAELYVSTSTGGKWSAPVNVTNNAGHVVSMSKATGARSAVATSSYWYPGTAAAAFDKTGHLVLVHVSNEHSIFGGSSFGVQTFGGSTSTPTLLFVRF